MVNEEKTRLNESVKQQTDAGFCCVICQRSDINLSGLKSRCAIEWRYKYVGYKRYFSPRLNVLQKADMKEVSSLSDERDVQLIDAILVGVRIEY